MADFGQLTAYQDDHDITFDLGRKKYKIKPTAAQVLDFMAGWEKIKEDGKRSDAYTVWEVTAPLLGGVFDRETFRFGPGPEGMENRDLIPELLDKGADIKTIGRLLSAVHTFYTFGEDVAEELYRTGDLGKAFANIKARQDEENGETPDPEIPPATGETSNSD